MTNNPNNSDTTNPQTNAHQNSTTDVCNNVRKSCNVFVNKSPCSCRPDKTTIHTNLHMMRINALKNWNIWVQKASKGVLPLVNDANKGIISTALFDDEELPAAPLWLERL